MSNKVNVPQRVRIEEVRSRSDSIPLDSLGKHQSNSQRSLQRVKQILRIHPKPYN